jgi:aminoglycoside phosphotransferase (APT) family kinase protein
MAEPLDRQTAFSGTKEVAAPLRFDTATLCQWLEARVAGFSGPLSAHQFKGGQSNPTYLVEAASGSYVLRRKPPGKLLPSAHAVDREYRVMKALGEVGYPVPKMYILCDDESVVGTMFLLMDKVEGRILWEPHMPQSTQSERGAIYQAMNTTLARLHSYRPEAIGLSDFGRPDNYVGRQIARWSKQYVASQTADLPAMTNLMDWLPGNLPRQPPATLVHGDFRLDNLILHPTRPEILAVLDWELSTLGDPIADFTYHCMKWHMPTSAGTGSLVGHDLAALGIPGFAAYVADYERRTGYDVRTHVDFYLAYNFFRIAAILQGIAGRVRDGTASNENAPAMARLVGPLADTAWSFAQQAGGS